MEKTGPKADTGQQPNKNKTRLLVLVAVVFALAGLAIGYFNVGLKNTAAQMISQDTKSITLPSITVNLVDNGYFKTTITLEYPSSRKLDEELETKLYKVKDSVLGVLRNTSTVSLKDPQETEALKQELLQEINSRLVCGKVTGIYFEEFIVQ